MKVSSLSRFRAERRRDDARYHRGELGRLIDEIGNEDVSVYARMESLVAELRADGFTDAAFHAIQALPLLKQAETHLEHAKGRIK